MHVRDSQLFNELPWNKLNLVLRLKCNTSPLPQNYLSIGVDALVTYNFHHTRENANLPFSGRLFNKLLYFLYGTKDVLERECKGRRDKEEFFQAVLCGFT